MKHINAMVRRSLKNGDLFIIGGVKYKGRLPEYKNIAKLGYPSTLVKVKSGLPFVRSKS